MVTESKSDITSIRWVEKLSPSQTKFLKASPSYEGDCSFCGQPVLLHNLGAQESHDHSVWHRTCTGLDPRGRRIWQITFPGRSLLAVQDLAEGWLKLIGDYPKEPLILPAKFFPALTTILQEAKMYQDQYNQDQEGSDSDDD